MTERNVLVPAWILHTRAWRDTSLLLEVFTQDHGRVGLIARGARGKRGRPLLQPLQPLLVSWAQRGELGTLGAVEAGGQSLGLRGTALYSALYCNELVLRLLQRSDPHPALYPAYEACLHGLLNAPAGPTLRQFEFALLNALGYGWDLEDVLDTAAHDRFVHSAGQLRPAPPGQTQASVDAACLRALAAGQLDEAQSRQLQPLLSAALAMHLSAPLRTPALLRSLRKLSSVS